jgi:DNA-directed RNA polymerase specialized sigma24 family protein
MKRTPLRHVNRPELKPRAAVTEESRELPPPQFRDQIKAWARRNGWRLDLFDEDDLEQEAFLVWHRVQTKYQDVPVMKLRNLFFRSLRNSLIDAMKKRDNATDFERLDTEEDGPIDVAFIDSGFAEVDWRLLRDDVPDWMFEVIVAAEQIEQRKRLRPSTDDLNTALCQLAGRNPNTTNLQKQFEEILCA